MKRQSAFNKALKEAQEVPAAEEENRETVKPLKADAVVRQAPKEETKDVTTVKPFNGKTVKAELLKTSFYLLSEQSEKLDDLVHDYKKRAGKRIDRQDVIRALIDSANLENLLRIIS